MSRDCHFIYDFIKPKHRPLHLSLSNFILQFLAHYRGCQDILNPMSVIQHISYSWLCIIRRFGESAFLVRTLVTNLKKKKKAQEQKVYHKDLQTGLGMKESLAGYYIRI